jgi:parallel beta-helix repeat protein
MRLKSTPQAEDGSDWLWPHNNDDHEWMSNYGAGIYVERSSGVTISDCFARRRQNGIIIDRVNDSKVFDNDCSFLSGWGLAMWRSSRNVVSRNALDFCVRGYSHGVYNRGQDSAGILFFEQCSENLIAENSATHGGDGFFGFAGREALGEKAGPEGFSVERAGCNDNLLINNDFSYAPAHGIELTFSFGNRFIGNRLVKNAICGVWGGYSQDTLIAGNLFEANGEMAYGMERGGVNIEHGAGNLIKDNIFRENKCAVHLWWDNDEGLLKSPWAQANHRGSTDNEIIRNRFEKDVLAIQLRECTDTRIGGNEFEDVGKMLDTTPGAEPTEVSVTTELFQPPEYEAIGDEKPVGARADLAGREHIIMGEYFPWDHQEPFARRTNFEGAVHTYQVLGAVEDFYVVLKGETAQFVLREPIGEREGQPYQVDVHGPAGVHPYVLSLRAKEFEAEFTDTLIVANWKASFFPWTVDPREDLDGWRAEAESAGARTAEIKALSFPYGGRGPKDMEISEAITQAGPGGNHFGMIATTKLVLPAGKWRVKTTSDDGVRVMVDGDPVLENWTWHAPTADSGEFEIAEEKLVEITVEHFEIDGHAVLEFGIEPVVATGQ